MDNECNSLDTFIQDNFKHLFPVPSVCGRCLYHYTSVNVLEILSRGETDLYLTKCSELNDDAELNLGVEVVLNYFERHPDKAWGATRVKIDLFKPYPEAVPWTFSLSREPDSLYQWIAYTDKHLGGVNIGVDFDELQRLVQKNNKATPESIESLMLLAPCIYVEGLQADDADKLMDFVFGKYRDVLSAGSAVLDSRMTKDMLRTYLTISLTFLVASVIKGYAFHYENEWRIVLIPSEHEVKNRGRQIGGRSRIASGIFGKEHRFADIWRTVCVSPQGSNKSLSDLILSARNIPLISATSKVTYNGR